MEQQHYFPPLHGAVDCEKCEVRGLLVPGKIPTESAQYAPHIWKVPQAA